MNKSTIWKGVLAVLVAAAPAFFTYLAARADSNEAKIRAEVAYTTMADAVKELQSVSYTQALQIARLEGRVEAQERFRRELSVPVTGTKPPTPKPLPAPLEPKSDGDGVRDVQEKLRAPPEFMDAVQQFKAKK